MRIELTISPNYLAGSWGAFEGIRELIQNAVDAQDQFSAPMEVTHYEGKIPQLRITNTGTTLDRKALLLGHTTKAGNADLRGNWGEGLKTGVLALLREGITVKIRTGGEVWVPSLAKSQTFDEDLLVFDIQKRNFQRRTRVEISPIEKGDWEEWKKRFLFLSSGKNSVYTSSGSLLLDAEEKGNIYVKGILTEHDRTLSFGYDLSRAELDRDRKMVYRGDLKWYIGQILYFAALRTPSLSDKFFDLLASPSSYMEAEGLSQQITTPESREAFSSVFKRKFGEEAFPVNSLGQSARLASFGREGIPVSQFLFEVLRHSFGNPEDLIKELTRKKSQYGWGDLEEEEQTSLLNALEKVSPFEERLSLDSIQITDLGEFRGLFESDSEGKTTISLDRGVLKDPIQTLATLIHETAHFFGLDGSLDHTRRIEELWSSVFRAFCEVAT